MLPPQLLDGDLAKFLSGSAPAIMRKALARCDSLRTKFVLLCLRLCASVCYACTAIASCSYVGLEETSIEMAASIGIRLKARRGSSSENTLAA